ncbi:MAG: riboflavin synthase [Planctomycetota bacterium]|nr:MAG: riboflavin synthase [Planctomycetota bacterium]
MFTGIIEQVSPILELRKLGQDAQLRLDLGPLSLDAKLGDSIAVNGACLTIASLEGGIAQFDISAETLRKTTAGTWKSGMPVNLERALALGDRLGGHLVSGHIDGVGRISERRREGDSERFTIMLPEDGSVRVVEKGSLAVDGISLTTWDCRGRRCSIAVIPHTLAHTTLGQARAGTAVNLEQDLLGRWVLASLPGGSS